MLFRKDLSKSVHCLLRKRRKEEKPEIDQAMISCMLRSGKRPALWARVGAQALSEVRPVGEDSPPKISYVMELYSYCETQTGGLQGKIETVKSQDRSV